MNKEILFLKISFKENGAVKLALARWDYLDRSNKGWFKTGILIPQYDKIHLRYNKFKLVLEELTGKNFKENTTFLISFSFVNDFCTNTPTITVHKKKLINGNNYGRELMLEINKKYPSVSLLHFYQKEHQFPKDLTLQENEFVFLDSSNLIKELLFQNPSMCGSYALVKPNGECLVHNGESRADFFVQHLKPENWSLFFDQNKLSKKQ